MDKNITVYNKKNLPEPEKKENIRQFLYHHLDEYGDEKSAIMKCMDYALQITDSPGGFIMLIEEENRIKAATVFNRTGMSGYIPENILVYIAVDSAFRGEGLGTKLMKAAIAHAEGDIALHVEPGNPAKTLYEKLGFTNPYLEMRLKKEEIADG